MQLQIIPLLLAAATSVSAELSRTGNITLFSDTTCENAVFINDWQVGRDFCAQVDNSPSGTDSPFRSFVLNARPWCDSGARPTLFVYRDAGCMELIKSYEPGPLYKPSGPDADGTCVAPGENYQAIAFICDGFEGAVTTTAAAVQSPMSSSIQGASTRTTEVEPTTTTTAQPTKTTSVQHDTTQGLTASTISSLSATGIDATSVSSSSGNGTMSSATSTAIVSAGTTWAAPEVAVLLGGLLSAVVIVL